MVEQGFNLENCISCGKKPQIIKEDGNLFYAICGCGKWARYEHLGSTRKNAIETWNLANRPITRRGRPKNEMHRKEF